MANVRNGYGLRDIYRNYNNEKIWKYFCKSKYFLWTTDEAKLISAILTFKRSPEWKLNPYNVSMQMHNNICKDYFKVLMAWLMEGVRIRLYWGLGSLEIVKRKSLNRPLLDYVKFNKTGEKVFQTNDHSQGFRVRFKWSKIDAREIPLLGSYGFKASFNNRRKLSANVKKINGHKKFRESWL